MQVWPCWCLRWSASLSTSVSARFDPYASLPPACCLAPLTAHGQVTASTLGPLLQSRIPAPDAPARVALLLFDALDRAVLSAFGTLRHALSGAAADPTAQFRRLQAACMAVRPSPACTEGVLTRFSV
jgi:hypothetical protein